MLDIYSRLFAINSQLKETSHKTRRRSWIKKQFFLLRSACLNCHNYDAHKVNCPLIISCHVMAAGSLAKFISIHHFLFASATFAFNVNCRRWSIFGVRLLFVFETVKSKKNARLMPSEHVNITITLKNEWRGSENKAWNIWEKIWLKMSNKFLLPVAAPHSLFCFLFKLFRGSFLATIAAKLSDAESMVMLRPQFEDLWF